MYTLTLTQEEYDFVNKVVCKASNEVEEEFNTIQSKFAVAVQVNKVYPEGAEIFKKLEQQFEVAEKHFEMVGSLHQRVHDLQEEIPTDAPDTNTVSNHEIKDSKLPVVGSIDLRKSSLDNRELLIIYGMLSSYKTLLATSALAVATTNVQKELDNAEKARAYLNQLITK